MDTDSFLFLNSTLALKFYYIVNRGELDKQLAIRGKKRTCAVQAWNATGIFHRSLYCARVGLRDAKHGETINMITTAAADYTSHHERTFMGPKESDDGLSEYENQLLYYWTNILRTAYDHYDTSIVLTLGGGGAYNGSCPLIATHLFTVLTKYGPDTETCWAQCFDHIIFAAKSHNVMTPLYTPYNTTFGSDFVRYIGPTSN